MIPRLSATVDYKQLPGGFSAVSGLLESHPDIQINYDTDVELYTLRGSYTKVLAALNQLLVPQSARSKHTGRLDPPVQVTHKQQSQESEDLSKRPNKETVHRENKPVSRTPDQVKPGRHGGTSVGGSGLDDASQAALKSPGATTNTSDEDCFLIVDADVFQYTQKNYQREYQQILSQYGVNTVEMTNQGLTTLFLRVVSETGDSSRDWEYLKLVRKAMSSFFQKNESTICRTPLSKSALESVQGLERTKTTLSVKLPKLLLNEDDRNVYIIGSPADVAQAKQLLQEQCKAREKKEDTASPLSFSPYSSASSGHSKEQRTTSSTLPTLESLAGKTDTEENERKSEGAKKYKLATRFKDSQLGMLASRPADLVIRGGPLPPSGSKYPGPTEGYDVVTETAKSASDRVPRAPGLITGEGSLFESGDALPLAASLPKKPSANSEGRAKDLSLPFSTSPLPPPGSGTTLKRASSFSGSSQPKVEVRSQGSQDDSSKSAVRTRPSSSSISCQTQMDVMGGFSAELTASQVIWQYIKEAYGPRVDDLTSDVQVKETRSEGSSDVTVTLRGGSQSKLSSCLIGLQKLVSHVSADFSVSQVRLSELGISDPADENLLACCADVHSRFEKVTTHILKKSLFLVGPQRLCSQVAASLREVFSGDLVPGTRQQELSAPSMSHWDSATLSKSGVEQWQLSQNHSQVPLEDGGGGNTNSGSIQETKLVNGSVTQPQLRVSPVVREKVKLVDTVEIDVQKKAGNRGIQSKALAAKDVTVQAVEGSSHSMTKDRVRQRHVETGKPPVEPRSNLGGSGYTCTCGGSGKSGKRSSRGADSCLACQQSEPRLLGIQGQMSSCKLHISLPGHKNSAIKVSYRIPNGIQEVRGFITALVTRLRPVVDEAVDKLTITTVIRTDFVSSVFLKVYYLGCLSRSYKMTTNCTGNHCIHTLRQGR